VDDVAFTPDGKTIASASEDATLRLWDTATGKPIGQPAISRNGSGNNAAIGLAFSPDGKTLAGGDYDGTVRLWEVSTGKPGNPLAGDTGSVFRLALTLGNLLTGHTASIEELAQSRR
jgi:WD40 repeat protein